MKNRRIIAKIKQYHSSLLHPDCTKKDKAILEGKIKEANAKIMEEYEQELLKKEEDAIKKIKDEPKKFFKYANKNRKTRTRIGPLKSGNYYYSGQKKWPGF